MADAIFQIKPSIYGIGIDLRAVWQCFSGGSGNAAEHNTARFVDVIEAHNRSEALA